MNEVGALVLGLFILGGLALLGLVFPILSFIRASQARRLAEQANDRVAALARTVQELIRDVEHLRVAAREAPAPAPPPEPAAASAERAPVAVETEALEVESEEVDNAAHVEAIPTSTEGVPIVPAGEPTPGVDHAASAGDESHEAAGAAWSPPSVPPVPPAWHPVDPAHPHTFEQRIGQRWLLYLGIAAVVLASSFLVKYAFDNEWITPAMRVVLGLLGGVGLVAIGDRIARRDVALFGQGLVGGGLGILYLSLYAALQYYDLVSPTTASAGMMLTTALGVWMATRHASQILAVIAAVGAYATPFLVAAETTTPLPLFTYLSVLALGTWWLIRTHEWPMLAIVAFTATAMTASGWLVTRYRGAQYLVVEAYLALLAGVFLATAFELHRRATTTAARATSSGALCALGAFLLGVAGPIAFHLASLALLSPHTQALLIYFIAVTLAGLLVSGDGERPWIRLAAWVGVVPPFLGWLTTHSQARGALVALFAIYGLHLIAELRALWHDRTRLRVPDGLLLHLNALCLLLGLLTIADSPSPSVMASLALALAAWHALLAMVTRGRHDYAPNHYVALVSAFIAAAIALRFDGPMIAMGWAIEGAALVWLGLRQRITWMRVGGWFLFVIAVADAIEVYGAGRATDLAPFFNMHAAAHFLIVGLLFWLASRYRAATDDLPGRASHVMTTAIMAGCVLLFLAITEEVNGFFGVRAWTAQATDGAMAAGEVDVARLATVSIVWAGYALVLVLIGILKRYRPVRYLAIGIFALTVLKVFFVDLAALHTLYRILSVMALGVLLLGASYLYQRFLTDDDAG